MPPKRLGARKAAVPLLEDIFKLQPATTFFSTKHGFASCSFACLPAHRVLGTVMGDTFPSHKNDSYYRNPTFYYIRYFGPFGIRVLEN